MKRLILSLIVFSGLYSGCIIQLQKPEPPGWEDPAVIQGLIHTTLTDLVDLFDRID